MPRVNRVAKCRVDQGRCGKCGDPLPRGTAYRWWKFRHGGKYKRCMKSECAPGRADLTQSPNLGTLYSLVDDVDLNLEALEPIAETVRDLANSVREDVAGAYRESAENIRSEFNYDNPTADECEEKADELEGYCDELDSAADEIENLADQHQDTEEDCDSCGGNGSTEEECGSCDGNGYHDDDMEQECDDCDANGYEDVQCPDCGGSGKQEVDDVDANDEQLEEARSLAQDAIDQCPL